MGVVKEVHMLNGREHEPTQCCAVAGDVLGYAEQATKCCSCAGYIKVFDAANHLIFTIERTP